MRTTSLLLILAVMVSGFGCKKTEPPKTPTTVATATKAETPEQAVAEIEKWGGKVKRDGDMPDAPVVEVNLSCSGMPDEGMVHLKGMTQLRTLGLANTSVTDAGLENLKGLTQLQVLFLSYWVTDAGLKNLEGLTQLKTLSLAGTEVTDAGMEHFKGLNQLDFLDLRETKVTDQGVKKLHEALPKCKIIR